jgi:membrane protein
MAENTAAIVQSATTTAGGATIPTTTRPLHHVGPLGMLKELYERFNEDQCSGWAAALSFFGILSFIPLLVCGIAALGFFIHDPHSAAEKVFNVLKSILPGANAGYTAQKIIQDAHIEEQAARLMQFSGWGTVVGVVSLIWAASRIFVSAAPPMNAAFRAKETRSFLMMQVYALGLLLAAGFLALLSFLPSSGPDLLRRISWFSGLPDPSPWWLDTFFLMLSVAINALMFMIIYRFLPSPAARVTWREATVGGVVAAILWEFAKQGFGMYLRSYGGSSAYDKLYGSLGGIIILILWVYYSSMILLLGAEIAELYSDVRAVKQAEEAKRQEAKRKRMENLTPQTMNRTDGKGGSPSSSRFKTARRKRHEEISGGRGEAGP